MDDIKRKLALIDRQLAGGFFNSYQRIINTSPLLFAAIGLIAGILVQNIFDLSVLIWLILLVFFAVAAIVLFIVQNFSSTNNQLPVTNYQYATAYLALIGFTCLGAIRLNSFYQPKPNDIRNFVGNEKNLTAENAKSAEKELKLNSANSALSAVKENAQKLATIRGLIITDPYINRNENWKFARFKFSDPDTSFYLKLKEIKTIYGWADVTGTIRVQVDEPILNLKAGDYIQAYCWLDRFKPPTNPGEFDIAK